MVDSNETSFYVPRTGEADVPPEPSTSSILAARDVVGRYLPATPMWQCAGLSRRHGRQIYAKWESVSPIRSFKAKGALVCVASLTETQKRCGVVTASTGNHAQGVACAGRILSVRVTVVVPESTDRVKLAAAEAAADRVLVFGSDLREAEVRAQQLAASDGLTYIEDGDDATIMAGAATIALEMMDAGIDLDTIVVPVGGGNLIAATLLAVRALNPDLTVIGVQSTAAPAATFSWLAGETVLIPSRTVAGGLATQHPGALSLRVMNALLERMLLVEDDDLIRAIGLTYELEGQVVEPAGAAAVAAVECHSDVIPGERLGLLVTGSCIGPQDLCRALRSVSESTSPM